MFGKKQKGYTVIELITVLVALLLLSVVGFVLISIVYALGKFLFGWWG